MTARWEHLPETVKTAAAKPRQPVSRGSWRCCGVGGCGEILTGTYAAAQRHVNDEHGTARLELIDGVPEAPDLPR